MPRDFLFDIGNVILKFDFAIAMGRLEARSVRPGETALDAVEQAKIDLESGRIDAENFVKKCIKLVHFQGSEDEFIRIWCEIFELNEPMAELIGNLAGAGARLFLFSNTSSLHKDYFLREYPVFEAFLDGIYSYSSRSMKPEEEIYRHAFESFSLNPEQTIYLDDRAENIATGDRFGLRSILYDHRRHADLLPRLAELGVEI